MINRILLVVAAAGIWGNAFLIYARSNQPNYNMRLGLLGDQIADNSTRLDALGTDIEKLDRNQGALFYMCQDIGDRVSATNDNIEKLMNGQCLNTKLC